LEQKLSVSKKDFSSLATRVRDMSRLLALLAVGAACAAALDLERDQRAELFDDALDEAEP